MLINGPRKINHYHMTKTTTTTTPTGGAFRSPTVIFLLVTITTQPYHTFLSMGFWKIPWIEGLVRTRIKIVWRESKKI
ncbi:hypothetical protein ACFX11_026379 [Malus domestica]